MNNLSWKQKSIIDMIDSLDNWRESLSGRDYKVSMTTDPYLSFLTVTLFDLDKDGKASFGVVVRKTMKDLENNPITPDEFDVDEYHKMLDLYNSLKTRLGF
ncbi:MAG TPA: hypothetical protein PKW59_11535 [Thermotogota bacterium]|jgi:hypothetical protein|nr:hypothetical protein [Thermotogota bacterium]HPM21800.1 hypothetical protein [Thermotogota bacterium]HQN23071.1 hypothetical protein [Thermotogota bacterium]HQQ66665.1 hypothetical protein [Thermotogota bacterium]